MRAWTPEPNGSSRGCGRPPCSGGRDACRCLSRAPCRRAGDSCTQPRSDEESLMPDSAHEPTRPAAHVRLGGTPDTDVVASMFLELWPEATVDEHRAEAASILSGIPPTTLPLVVFVAEAEDKVIGFIEVGLRSHADGCDTRQPVGF